jgi:capsular exopolysaccharide synthesis family protein
MNTTTTLRDLIDVYTSKWKLIALCTIISLIVAFLYLRYTTYQYQSTASIKLKDDKQNNQLSKITAVQDYGLFSDNFTNTTDEIEILKSRSILTKVVEDLNLNISYYISGRVKEKEVYINKPLNLSFIASDSIIHRVDTTFYVNIVDDNNYKISNRDNKTFLNLKNDDNDDDDDESYAFGDLIKTSFGDLIITPNLGVYGTSAGSQIKIKIMPVNRVVESYKLKIKVSNINQSNILTLALNESIKQKAEMILNKLIEKYNQDSVEDKKEIVKITSDFINNRLEIVSLELDKVDLTAETLQKNNRLTDLATQSSIYLQSEKENEQRLINTTNQIQLIDYMSDYVAQEERETDLLPANVGIADNNVATITKGYNDLVLERDRILKNSSKKNPIVINLNNQISALKSNLNQSLKSLKSSNQITLKSLNREDRRISSQIYSAPKKQRQFRDIKRQQNIKESLYLYLLEKREETAITLGMSPPNAKIIEPAYTSNIPISPKKKIIYLGALILGLFIPISLIYISELMDSKIHNKNDVLKLVKAPFIGDIPKSNKKKQLVSKVDYSPRAEAFRILRTNIDFMLKNKNLKGKTIFVTSTTKQEGKSHTSVNLAASISFSGKKVLLLETDIRVPRVDEYFEITSKQGLTDYIINPDLTIKDITISVKDNVDLDIIPSGTVPPNPAELLMSNRMIELFKDIKKRYDYIVVDTAAVGLVTDTLLICDHADIFIYVVSANNIDKRQLHIAQTMYEEKRLPNMSILLNGTLKKKGYGYGYGSEPKKKKWFKFKFS